MKTKNIIRIILAILGGEIALIILTTIAQEVLFKGIRYNSSSNFELIFGGLATFIAAVLAGYVARIINKEGNKLIPLVISMIIITETTYLISINLSKDPVWFDAIAGASLVVGVWLGFYIKELLKNKGWSTNNA
jgi:hypothetical protein